jgi:hypothetical protein
MYEWAMLVNFFLSCNIVFEMWEAGLGENWWLVTAEPVEFQK